MSYTISAKRPTKDELELAIRDELAGVPKTQSVHEADIDQAFNAMKSLLDLMEDDPERDLYCAVSCSILKNEAGVQNIGLNVSISFTDRPKA
jgi:hypothetical protein